jgi:hypothetical protein
VGVVVELSEADYAEARGLADASMAKWGHVERVHYRTTLSGQLVGRMGEMAVFRWMEGQGGRPLACFRDADNDGLADVIEDEDYVEVKTWSEDTWVKWGRCVRPAQLPSLRRKANLIVWCFAWRLPNPAHRVTLAGWSRVEDIEALPITLTGPPEQQLANHQMPLDALRGMEEW